MHHWKETGEAWPEWANPTDATLLEKKLLATGIRREHWWTGGVHEETFALDLFTLALHRPPSGDDHEVWKAAWPRDRYLTGTVDYRGYRWIDDFKTGRWPVFAEANDQLRSYALFDWVECRCPGDYRAEVTITQWPKYRIDELPTRRYAIVTALELEEHLDNWRWAVTHPKETNPDGTGEGHCRFCDAQPSCPEWSI